jgi:pyruvate/2-oxoglutarate dehydrogenase complex dihydrolipoamide acyltransferase (E2) component
VPLLELPLGEPELEEAVPLEAEPPAPSEEDEPPSPQAKSAAPKTRGEQRKSHPKLSVRIRTRLNGFGVALNGISRSSPKKRAAQKFHTICPHYR